MSKPSSRGVPLTLPPSPIHAALPGDAAGVDVQRVALLDGVVDHGRQQVVGGADGVDVAGKVEVDVLHGDHLGVAAAGRAPLDAEHRTEAGFPQAEHRAFPQGAHGIGQAHAGGGLALARRRGADGGDQNQPPLGPFGLGQFVAELGFVPPVGDHLIFRHAEPGRHLGDRLHLGALSDLNVGEHERIFLSHWALGEPNGSAPGSGPLRIHCSKLLGEIQDFAAFCREDRQDLAGRTGFPFGGRHGIILPVWACIRWTGPCKGGIP